MRRTVKPKKVNPVKHIVPDPQLGDIKYVNTFALFPVKIENEWVWMEKYTNVYVFKEGSRNYKTSSNIDIFLRTWDEYESRWEKYWSFSHRINMPKK